MAALHAALQSLSPTSYTSVPRDQNEATLYLHGIFEDAQKIVDSVPLPPLGDPAITAQTQSRTRSATSTSEASCISDISSSSARSDPLDPSNVSLQNEWGKPMKLNAKDNPLGMAVYRLGGKDGKGAWFARRSVHEGLAFERWKSGLQREFPESLEVQGGPGEGNIRGIGGERRAGTMSIDGVGTVDGKFQNKSEASVGSDRFSLSSICTIPWAYDTSRLCDIASNLILRTLRVCGPKRSGWDRKAHRPSIP